jgi:hypothetical protein
VIPAQLENVASAHTTSRDYRALQLQSVLASLRNPILNRVRLTLDANQRSDKETEREQ